MDSAGHSLDQYIIRGPVFPGEPHHPALRCNHCAFLRRPAPSADWGGGMTKNGTGQLDAAAAKGRSKQEELSNVKC